MTVEIVSGEKFTSNFLLVTWKDLLSLPSSPTREEAMISAPNLRLPHDRMDSALPLWISKATRSNLTLTCG